MSKIQYSLFLFTICMNAFAIDVPLGHFAGSYMVPGPVETALEASNANTYMLSKDQAGNLILQYTLPAEITGLDPVNVKLTESTDHGGGVIHMRNLDTNDDADCKITDKSLVCFVMYPDLTLSDQSVQAAIKKNHPLDDAIIANRRKQIALVFEGDPKGVVYCPFTDKK